MTENENKTRRRLTPGYEGRDLAKERLFVYYSKDGVQRKRTYLVWTTKGARMISRTVGCLND